MWLAGVSGVTTLNISVMSCIGGGGSEDDWTNATFDKVLPTETYLDH